MVAINFGNLMDWGQVVEKLEELKKEKRLDDCQEELIRVLRYRYNWRLREIALEYIRDVQNPTENLLICTLNMMTDNNIYYEARILATEALAELAKRKSDTLLSHQTINTNIIIENMESLLISTQPPLFHDTLKKCLTRIKGK